MSTPILTTSVNGRLRPHDDLYLAQLSWDAPEDTVSTIIQRKRASGQWEDVVTVGRFLPPRFIEYVPAGLRTYRVVRTRRVNGILVHEISGEQVADVGLTISTYNGDDPILGPPNAPKNYQLFVVVEDRGQGKRVYLTWTIPEVIVDVEFDSPAGVWFLNVINYFQEPAIAGQSGPTITAFPTGGDFVFLPEMVGYQVRWFNLTQSAVIQAYISPTQVTVTPSQTINARSFALIPPGPGGASDFTTFDLYRWDGVSAWPRVGESTNSYAERVDWRSPEGASGFRMSFRLPEAAANPGGPVYGVAPGENHFYVRAVSGSVEVFSPIVSITI